ncbi:DUF456 family protein [Neisseria leonii]|uniref:DUF456 family protein n=1 Tax=Neisseria leonii TaxID=2995413 RepID=A0A9X4E196_9NEIS|nr:DUF456 family protein [Neisseria sp. 51.81]MDD9326914.1 DUF456 family protein [Neisseria sp. 51.81]
MTVLLFILGLMALLAGLLGTVYPALPGLGLMFAGAWLLAYSGDYRVIGGNTVAVLAVVAALGTLADYVAGMLGAKFSGAGRAAVWGAFAGGIVGAFFALPGLLLGPPVGAAAGQLWSQPDIWRAGKAGIGTFIGFVVGTAAKVGCAFAILMTLVFSAFF